MFPRANHWQREDATGKATDEYFQKLALLVPATFVAECLDR